MKKGGFSLEQFTRINHDIGIMGGKACIAGTRITVSAILLHISEGVSFDEILKQYPHLVIEDLMESLRYAAWVVGSNEAMIMPA